MYSNLFSPDSIAELTVAMQTQFPKAIWETFYVTLLSTALAVVIGLPLGVLLVAGEKGGVLPPEADAFLESCRVTYGLEIEGLMCIPPADEPPSPHFALPTLFPSASYARRNHSPSQPY